MKLITKRLAKVIEFGNTIGITLRPELLDLGVGADDDVLVTVYEDDKKSTRKIVIRKNVRTKQAR